jgi:arginine-tRNA-protein transferase
MTGVGARIGAFGRVLKVVEDGPRVCSYLPDRSATLLHHLMLEVTPARYERLMEMGVRRFGPDYFAPVCSACDACEPTRVDARAFVPSKSQRRVLKKGVSFIERYGPPQVDDARLALYHAWHAVRETRRAWDESELDARTYEMQFAFPHPVARELTLFDGDKLICVSLCDETPNALSAVYCFHDPTYAGYSLGTLNVLRLLERAKSTGRSHVYLGYHVAACPSLAYKGAFHPQERLTGRPYTTEATEATEHTWGMKDGRDSARTERAWEPEWRPVAKGP